MVQINLQIKGLERVENLFRNLPGELQKEINLSSKQFLQDVRKSAKLRAPRFTGQLSESIVLREINKNQVSLVVESPYGAKMETGKGLPGWFNFPGYTSKTRGQYFIAGGGAGVSPGAGYKLVRRYKPFIQPALEHNIARFQTILSDSTKRAIRQSRR